MDVESNPGPTYDILSSVQGSFNQGNILKFGLGAGTQCACNSLYAICWSIIKKVSRWQTNDLDHILTEGDRVYKCITTDNYALLCADDLPDVIQQGDGIFIIDKLRLETGEATLVNNFPFLSSLFDSCNNKGDGFLFFIRNVTLAIIPIYDTHSRYYYYYLFDSHSRDERGLVVEDGQSVLLKFRDLLQVEKYFQVVYLEFRDCQSQFFQMQFVKVTVSNSDKLKIQLSFQNKLRRVNEAKIRGSEKYIEMLKIKRDRHAKISGSEKHIEMLKIKRDRRAKISGSEKHIEMLKIKSEKQREHLAKISGSEKHIEMLKIKSEKQREYLATISGSAKHKEMLQRKCEKRKEKISKENHVTSRIYKFKKSIQEGPFYICVVCNRCLYKKTVLQFDRSKYENIEDNVFSFVRSYDSKYYICSTCHKTLKNSKVPCQAVCNKLELYDLPRELQDIRRLERVLVSKRLLFKKVTIMPKGQFPKVKGAICNVPISDINVSNILPREANSNGIVLVKLKRKLEYRGHVYFEAVRPGFVYRLLNYLKENNELYSDVEIDTESIPEYLKNWDDNDNKSVEINQSENVDILKYLVECSHIPIPIEFISHDRKSENSNKSDDEEIDFQLESIDLMKYLVDCQDIPLPIEVICDNEESDDEFEMSENPLDAHRTAANETALMPNTFSSDDMDEEFLNIAPGEGKQPVSILGDKFCEEAAHPHLFPTGKFGYSDLVGRDIPLPPFRYFNQRLLNYTQKFANDSDYIFFAHSVLLRKRLMSQINIAMQMVPSNSLTAGMLGKNFKETVKNFIASDKAFSFMNAIKGSPQFWKRFLLEVMAMVKQLGPPTFFLTLSCADLRWNELIKIISKLKNGREMSDEEVNNLSYFERCELLNSNPVLLARHFQYRVEAFFKEILMKGPLGKILNYAIRVEFQVRGSPHVHCFIWVENAPKLTADTEDAYVSYINNIVNTSLPDHSNKELYELVKMYQLHRHSKTCRKYKNKPCRFNFGRFFCDRTIIAKPIPETVSEAERSVLLSQRNSILSKVKKYINDELNPKNHNFFDPTGLDYQELPSIDQILEHLEISKDDYENALSISDDTDFQLHLKRSPNSCFVNNYFTEGILAWEANLDIQPVFNYYKAITYMCAYLSKTEDECSQAMSQAAKEAYENNLSCYDQMKSIAHTYANKRELSVQEAVYHIMPELWLRKIFPAVVFANSNLPEKRYRMLLTENEIKELPPENTKIYKRNMLERYIDRPNAAYSNGKYRILDNFCYAEFLRYYTLSQKPEQNDCQPEELTDELVEVNHPSRCSYPSIVPLMSSKSEKLKCRKVPLILRYHVPNRNKNAEEYAHHLLFMFYPFRSEESLKSFDTDSYVDKLNELGVLDIVNRNKSLVEPFSDLVDEAFLQFRSDLTLNSNVYGQQENEEIINELTQLQDLTDNESDIEELLETSCDITAGNLQSNSQEEIKILSDNEINARIQSLNAMQRKIFNFVHKWARDFVKNLSSINPISVEPFHIFVTGGAGVGKSHLLKTIYHSVTKLFLHKSGEPDKPRILVLAPTGVAAVNISGTTIHTGLGISTGGKLYPLNDKRRAEIRLKLSAVEMIMIDEISMVSSQLFRQIDSRLREIFGLPDDPFAKKPVIVCGDLYQLPPVKGAPIYKVDSSCIKNIISLELWALFTMCELTEVMRQKGDSVFIDLLNQVRVGQIDSQTEELLKSRFISTNDEMYPSENSHIYAENEPANKHNEAMLKTLEHPLVEIFAKDEFPKHCNLSDSQIRSAKTAKVTDTGGLPYLLQLKIDARVMITKNINIEDRLINGQVGFVRHFKHENGQIKVIYLELDDKRAGLQAVSSDAFARQNNLVPIRTADETFNIKLGKNSSNSPSIRRTQFPLMLSWACTCHKVQGLGMSSAVISFNLNRQRYFNPGQMYVALSRVTTLQGLFLIGEYSKSAIKVNESAAKEYERLRKYKPFSPLHEFQISYNELHISLLNTRSLKKHAVDISHDKRLCENDILCLTETQLMPTQCLTEIENYLSDFDIEYNTSSINKFKSLAICHKTSLKVLNHEKHEAVSIFKFRKESFFNREITLALLYRQSTQVNAFFYDDLIQFVRGENVDILLGDFNINALEPANLIRLKNALNEYELINDDTPTHIEGSLLDHVFIKRNFLSHQDIATFIINIPFSDHDAVKIILKQKNID